MLRSPGLISPITNSLSHSFHINLLLVVLQALAQLQLIDYIGEQTALLIKVSFYLNLYYLSGLHATELIFRRIDRISLFKHIDHFDLRSSEFNYLVSI